MNIVKIISVYLFSFCFCQNVFCESKISIEDLWINEAPPNMTVLAAYGAIHNNTDSDLILEKIESSQFETIEIHTIIIKDDISKMLKQDNFSVKKGAHAKFSPGGMHIMLYEPKTPVKKGDSFDFIFYFSDGSQVQTKAIVKKLSETSNHHHHH